jgi:hypothetical protein
MPVGVFSMPGGNLWVMATRSYSTQDKLEFINGWRCSGLTQDHYARDRGISPRTLRAWMQKHAVRRAGATQVRAVIVEAMGRLQALLDALDAGEPGRAEPPGHGDARCQPEVVPSPTDRQPDASAPGDGEPVVFANLGRRRHLLDGFE